VQVIMVLIFERPLPSGWIYPCRVEDIRQQCEALPKEDLEGLWAIGLIPSTNKERSANGRYVRDDKPTVSLYSYPATLTYKQPAYVKQKHILQYLTVELEFGMRIEPMGSRWLCKWTGEDLRRFIVGHVLLHEIGHHVYHEQRARQGYAYLPRTQASEQFAEDYALRYAKNKGTS
jgi:hypothetical protein